MLTIRLWKSLNEVLQRNPFYWELTFQHRQRYVEQAKKNTRFRVPKNPIWRFLRGAASVLRGLLGLYLAFGLLFVGLPLIPVIFLGAGTILGVRIAYALSVFVSALYEKNRIDLLAVTPPGLVGLYWTLSRVMYWRLRLLQNYGAVVYGLCLVSGVFIVLVWVISLSNLFFSQGLGMVFANGFELDILLIGLLPLALFVDIQQSIITGTLLGVLVPSYGWDRLSANVMTVGVFLSLQAAIYIAGLLIVFTVGELIYDSFSVFSALSFSLFYLLREAVIRLLWGRWVIRFERG